MDHKLTLPLGWRLCPDFVLGLWNQRRKYKHSQVSRKEQKAICYEKGLNHLPVNISPSLLMIKLPTHLNFAPSPPLVIELSTLTNIWELF